MKTYFGCTLVSDFITIMIGASMSEPKNCDLNSRLSLIYVYTAVSERAPMCRAPFRSAKDGGGHFLSVSAFNHEKAPWLCLQRLDALKAHNWTNNKMKQNHQWFHSRVLMVHSTLNSTMSPWAWCSSHCIIATSVYAKMLCYNIQWSITQISYLRHAQCLRLCFSNFTLNSLNNGRLVL